MHDRLALFHVLTAISGLQGHVFMSIYVYYWSTVA